MRPRSSGGCSSARGRRPADPLLDPGRDRCPARRPATRDEVPAGRCRGRGWRVLVRRACRDGRPVAARGRRTDCDGSRRGSSSMPASIRQCAGQDEYAFAHALTRDVAYAQLPRASRASRHVSAAGWIEALAAGRTEDVADVLAYHYTTGLELGAGDGPGGTGCGPGATRAPVPHSCRRPGTEPRRSRSRVVLRAGFGADTDRGRGTRGRTRTIRGGGEPDRSAP